MTIPTSYTETELQRFMHDTLAGPVTAVLDWTVDGPHYDEPIIETLLAYGVTDIAQATDIVKLRRLAAVMAWRAAKNAAAGLITFSTFGDKYELATVQERIGKALADSERQAGSALGSISASVARVSRVTFPNDPYAARYPEDR